MDYAEELVNEPPQVLYSLEEIIEQKRQIRRDAVDLEALAQQRGLAVWLAHGFDGYWCQEYGEFNELPEGWDILWKGDAAFTRRVRKGLHWVIMTKKKEWTEVAGTAAPVENIECAFEELGGEEGAKRRQRGKEKGQKKREKHLTEQLKTAILQRFPKIPKEDLSCVLETCRRPGAVGTAQWLYFTTKESNSVACGRAAYLAARAHVRHNYTQYDEILSKLSFELPPDDAKKAARSSVASRIERVLEEWK